ncbi:hypothetical protein LNQ03_31240 [Klebsiella pneumoniae subsp. pneumoniae]|nr:hypothetical protein [Klebsiella pneumoniae subsp. pneumoniae]
MINTWPTAGGNDQLPGARWLVQQALAQLAPQWLAFYPLVNAAGGVSNDDRRDRHGMERTIIRHLYGVRWKRCSPHGISLMLISW